MAWGSCLEIELALKHIATHLTHLQVFVYCLRVSSNLMPTTFLSPGSLLSTCTIMLKVALTLFRNCGGVVLNGARCGTEAALQTVTRVANKVAAAKAIATRRDRDRMQQLVARQPSQPAEPQQPQPKRQLSVAAIPNVAIVSGEATIFY